MVIISSTNELGIYSMRNSYYYNGRVQLNRLVNSIVCSACQTAWTCSWTRVRCNLWHLLPTFLSYAKQKTEATNLLLLRLLHKSARQAHIIAASKLLFICLKMKQLLASSGMPQHATGSSAPKSSSSLRCGCETAHVRRFFCFACLFATFWAKRHRQPPQLLNMPHSVSKRERHTHTQQSM